MLFNEKIPQTIEMQLATVNEFIKESEELHYRFRHELIFPTSRMQQASTKLYEAMFWLKDAKLEIEKALENKPTNLSM